jgi:Xaa-Pro dipeptidase
MTQCLSISALCSASGKLSDPEKHRLCRDLPRIFDELKQYFDEHSDVTGAKLYSYAQRCAEEAGWLFGGAIAGHIVGEFPHARIPGNKDLYRISPANHGRLRDPDAAGHPRHWIIEVHLVDRSRNFGGFYERLLLPAGAGVP